MSEVQILIQFKNCLISFLDELISQFPSEADLVIFRIFLKDRVPIVDVMNYFVLKLSPFKDMVKSRDEDFFLNKCNLFENFGDNNKQSKVNKFKSIWRSEILDNDDKKVIWEWFDTFIYLSEKYQSCKK